VCVCVCVKRRFEKVIKLVFTEKRRRRHLTWESIKQAHTLTNLCLKIIKRSLFWGPMFDYIPLT
jgi:hypothetical protein